MKKPSIDELRKRLSYNPDTGDLVWIRAKSDILGKCARSLDVGGYIQISLAVGSVHKGHRVAWALHYGRWPDGPIDHINGIRNDNRIANLREVDHQTNCQNVRLGSMKNKSTGFLGVHIGKSKKNPYRAKIMHGGKQYHLGGYPTPEEAHAAYVEAKRKLHKGCTI